MKLPRGCRIIEFPSSADKRGTLSVAEASRSVPYQIARVFWIYDVPEGESRGNHSHNESAEVVVPVNGAFTMVVDDGNIRVEVRMDSPRRGILIPPGIWCELTNFAPNTVCIVFASHPYNAEGYTNSYEEFCNSLTGVVRYDSSKKSIWDNFVRESKNGTFLIERGYMDYHSHRFTDVSLMFYKKGKLIALLPANLLSSEKIVYSHGGLTYGGLIMSDDVTAVDVLDIFSVASSWMADVLGAKKWIYKPIPYIYSSHPSDEDLYALFRMGAKLTARSVSSATGQKSHLPFKNLRKRGVNRAIGGGVECRECPFVDGIDRFWSILEDVLIRRHNTKPVHSVEEITMLHNQFPNNIKLYVSEYNGEIVAGSILYITTKVVHAQYIAASDNGKKVGALDLLFKSIIESSMLNGRYFDFGVSTESNGTYLNKGLISQKEGFGARAVVYDTYEMEL